MAASTDTERSAITRYWNTIAPKNCKISVNETHNEDFWTFGHLSGPGVVFLLCNWCSRRPRGYNNGSLLHLSATLFAEKSESSGGNTHGKSFKDRTKSMKERFKKRVARKQVEKMPVFSSWMIYFITYAQLIAMVVVIYKHNFGKIGFGSLVSFFINFFLNKCEGNWNFRDL